MLSGLTSEVRKFKKGRLFPRKCEKYNSGFPLRIFSRKGRNDLYLHSNLSQHPIADRNSRIILTVKQENDLHPI